jgi:DNA helicase-2/ATP-dependent DNA helicase PcrA
MQILRSKMILSKEWPIECQHFGNAWFEHMGNEGKTDFNGMLEQCLDRELSPDIKILMVDEAQDLPALQTALIRQWGECCDEVFWVGDGNQSIFRFAGADPNNFINLEADKVIELKQSYRLSPAILHKSMEIIKQANVKEIVDFKPTDKYGSGQILNVRKPDLSLPGTHMILCRCKFQVQKYINILRKANIPFCNQYRQEDKAWNPLTLSGAESIKVFLKIRRLEKINIYEIKQLIKNCKAKTTMRRGTKKKIESMPLTEKKEYDLLELLSIGFLGTFIDKHEPLNYYFNIKSDASDLIYHLAENDPKQFLETPRICVGTGHSVKGGSCDHVWIDSGITTKIKKAMANDPDAWDDECRTAYVMCSRARKTIGFINSGGYKNPFLR